MSSSSPPAPPPHSSSSSSSAAAAAADDDARPVVVELDGVSKSYALDGGEAVHALRHVSLLAAAGADPASGAVRRGEFVMIRGPSGGGKTSLLNLIGTLDAASGGAVRLFGQDVTRLGDAALAALRLARIGFVFQSFNLLSTLSALENVELPMSLLGRAGVSAARRRADALALLRLVGLEERASHLPSELSGGEQQRVAIARALANEPELLLLDEPTGDLDTRSAVRVMDLLLDVNRARGMTCVMVTHNADLEVYASRVLYVADGRVVGVALNSEQTRLDEDAYRLFLERAAGGEEEEEEGRGGGGDGEGAPGSGAGGGGRE